MRKLLLVTLMLSVPLAAADFDYYLLTLSWAPEYCAQANGKAKSKAKPKASGECGVGNKVGFVVHGLWPQNNNGPGPESCDTSSSAPPDVVQATLGYIPTAGLIQHEWTTHGTCTGLTPSDYFALVRKARDSVNIPTQFQAPTQAQTLSPTSIEAEFQATNPTFPSGTFRTACMGRKLQEARACFAKDLTPIACTSSVADCRSASISVLPVR